MLAKFIMCLKESWEILSRAAVFKNVRERSMDKKYHSFSLFPVAFFFFSHMKIENIICNHTIAVLRSSVVRSILRYNLIFQYFHYKCLICHLNSWQKLGLLQMFYCFSQSLPRELFCCWNSKNSPDFFKNFQYYC